MLVKIVIHTALKDWRRILEVYVNRNIAVLLRNVFVTLQQYLNVHPKTRYSEMLLEYFNTNIYVDVVATCYRIFPLHRYCKDLLGFFFLN